MIIIIQGNCVSCGKSVTVKGIKEKDYLQWKVRGRLIQDVLGYLSVGDREFLISKICSECFDKMFKG